MNFTFISDFFVEDVNGGAEFCDAALLEELRKNHDVVQIRSHEVTTSFLKVTSNNKIIISNFINLQSDVKQFIQQNCDYILYEHDHKYLTTRDPSFFKDYKAPSNQIINQEFYNNAIAVVCQSQLHGDVVSKNLPFANVVVAHFSLWLDEQLKYLETMKQHDKKEEDKRWFVLDSKISHKNTHGSIDYCKKHNLAYHLTSGDWNDIVSQFMVSKGLVFFPQTLETMSRIVVEARMLGCKVICSQNIGAVHEDWFNLKGQELIDLHRQKKTEICQMVVDLFQKPKPQQEDITVILTLYRRPQNLEEQVQAILNQTKPPKEIWLWVNDHQDNYLESLHFVDGVRNPEVYHKMGIDKVVFCDYNWKFYGRFSLALMATTKYVAIFDDDSLSGKKWFENCLNTLEQHPNSILGSAGVILQTPNSYNPHKRVGWPSMNDETTEVDLVGHSWFLEQKHVQNLWREPIPTFDNGEDIQLAYCCQKYAGLKTLVPPHPQSNKSLWGSIKGNELGIDKVATSNNSVKSHDDFFSERDKCVRNAVENGWQLCKNKY